MSAKITAFFKKKWRTGRSPLFFNNFSNIFSLFSLLRCLLGIESQTHATVWSGIAYLTVVAVMNH